MKKPVFFLFIAFAMLAEASSDKAQTPLQQAQQQKETSPATKLEAFSAKTGVVIIRGYTTVGEVRGMGSVSVEAREFRDASDPKRRITGLAIRVKESGSLERDSASFVDYDEIDSLLQGIDYISKLEQSVTAMKNFEAEYKTKGDFSITVFSMTNGSLSLAVSGGRFGKVSAYLKIADLEKLRTLIQNAKAQIDALGK